MEHSLEAYISRRSKEELELIISLYEPLSEDDYYNRIVSAAKKALRQGEDHSQ